MVKLKFSSYKPTEAEKQRRSFLEERLRAMDTPYRKSAIEMAKLGRAATDGIVMQQDRVSNAELIKVPISNAVVMQRLSTLMDNPSKAIYKTPSREKSRLTTAEQLNKHDKREGRYTSSYHDFMRTAEVEGTCFVKQGWHEEFKKIGGKLVTVGKMYCSQEKVLIENFFWDASASELRGSVGSVANDAFDREYMSVLELRRRWGNDDNFKNINAVKPLNNSDPMFGNHVQYEESEEGNGDENPLPPNDTSREVCVWHYHCRNYYDPEDGTVKDVRIDMANGVEIRIGDIPTPKIKGKAELPYAKFVAIPTAGMCGISMPALIRHPENCLQRMITMADAQAELAVNPIQFMSPGIMDTLDQAPVFPGSRVEVQMQGRTVQDEIYFHSAPDITNGAQYIIDKMLNLIVMISGVDIQALFESPRQKAISTERKREVQERLLRYSVIYNESHGFFDLEEMRLYLMLQNYPVKRYFLDMQENGEEKVVQRYPKIPVDGFVVKVVEADLNKSVDEKRFELKKQAKSLDLLTINPASIEYNIHIYVEGATEAANDDSFALNKNIEKLNLIATNQWTTQVTDPLKASRKIFEMLNVDEDDYIKEELEKTSTDMHGAMKEIQALMLKDSFEIPLKLYEDYDAKEFAEIFARFIALKDFKELSITVRQALIQRYQYHLKNSLNPFYKEQLQEAQAQEQAQMEQNQAMANEAATGAANANKVIPPNPRELKRKVDSSAGKLGKAGKTREQKASDQRTPII